MSLNAVVASPAKTEECSNQDFDNELVRILSDMKACELLDVPGIYEIVSEHYNNEVLDNLNIGPNEPYFSKRACDNCGDCLTGDRYNIVYRETLKGPLLEAKVCTECFINLCG